MGINQIKKVCVVGSGSMGHQIAMLFALANYETTLHDIEEASLKQAKSKLETLMDGWVNKKKISEEIKMKAFDHLTFTPNLNEAARDVDFVVEAVVERLDVKRDVFKQLDALTPPHTILATNSSTIVSSMIATATQRKDKICNMHFFFPPLVMDCVEVVKSEYTSEETAQTTLELCKKINRTGVLLRKEISGFVANRILGALMKEALFLYEEGIADFKDIDLVVKKSLSHPLGPFELMDLSGIDIAHDVMQQRYQETGDEGERPPESIKEKVKQGHLGRKTGQGWYNYLEKRNVTL